jgi:murein DD-endopeptidase MepM/ murein hydrolase activator NlpD
VAPRTIVTGVATAAALLALGVGAALADSPPTTSDSTTTTTTDTQTTDTTTTSTTSSTTTTTTTTTTQPPSTERTTTSPVSPPPPRPRPAPPARHTTIPAGASRQEGAAPAGRRLRSAAAGRGHEKKRRVSKPLRVTPPLGQRTFVFPVAGPASYGDNYGTFRGDVHGRWHHGDDIFAPLGTPVVAVASGTVNRIGWRPAGGWRLWVRDSAADQFYYAHLSGYARSLFHSKRVRAGQVIGYVGDTGDAYGGETHLHFEIHPRQLLRLRYDGAVDPTTYLERWTHAVDVEATRPLLPRRFPKRLDFRRQARSVFHQLLLARHLLEPEGQIAETRDRSLAEVNVAAAAALGPSARSAPASADGGTSALLVASLAGVSALAVFGLAVLLLPFLRTLARVSPKRP